MLAVQADEEIRKIELSEPQPDHRHQNVIDQRRDDLAKGGADDNADRQVKHVPPQDEFLELTEHVVTSSASR